MEEVKVKIGIDDKGFATGLQRDIRQMEQLSATAKKGGMSIDDMGRHVKQLGRDIDAAADKGVAGFSRLEKAAIGFFTIQKAKEFIGKVYEVRSEIEKLETSFRILVGNRAEADALFASIRKFAVETPMQLKDLAGAAQTMMGFGIAAGDVMENLKALGNVAMGDSQKFQSLALAFSQMSATGKLMGQDFLQMVNAGFNPLDQMAKTTGKSVAELKKEMSEGAISADMVRQAFIDATSEGGKFNGMLEAQSKTMAGAYSNLQGAIEDMFNEIGEKSEGIMKGAIEVATLLAKNYETVGKVLLQLIATYGSYKVAVMAVTAAEAVLNGTYTLKIRLLRAAVVAQQLLNKTMLANPFVAVATAVLAVVSALIIFRNRTDEAAEAQKRLKESFDTTQAKIAAEQKNIDTLFEKLRKARKGTAEYKETKDAILSQYGDYLKGLGAEIEQLINVEGAYKAVARAAREAALARGREAALGEANEQYGKNYASSMGKLREAIIDKAGKQEATTALNQIQKELRETGTISGQTEAKVRNLLRGSFSYGESAAWFTTLRNNEQALQDAVEQADELFRTEGKKVEDETVKAKTLGEAYAEAQKKYEEAYKKVEDMKNARAYYTEQQWKDAQEALKNAKKAFEDIGGDPDGKQQRKGDAAAKRKSEAEKKQAEFLTLMGKHATERERAIKDLELSTRQAEIDAMQDGSEKTIAQLTLDFEKRREEIERSYQDLKRQKIEAARKLWEADPANKNKTFNAGSVDTTYSAAETENYQKQLQANVAAFRKAKEDERNIQAQAMLDYLKEYGSVEQQRYAITREYDEKIAKEKDEWRKKSLEAEKKSMLAQMDAKNLAEGIDWNQTFSGIGNILKDIARDTLEEVEKYMKTADFKGLSADAKQSYASLRNQLVEAGGRESTNPFSSKTWDEIGRLANEYRDAVMNVKLATETHREAVERVAAAERKVEEAANGSVNEKALAKQELEDARKWAEETKNALDNERNRKDDAGQKLHTSTEAANQGLQDFSTVLGQVTSGTLTGFVLAVGNLINKISGSGDKAATEIGDLFGEAGKQIGGIIGAILSIIDALGDDPAGFVDDILNKVADVIQAVIEQLPEIIMSVIKGVGNIVGGVFKGIGGLFGFGGSDNSKEQEAKQDEIRSVIETATHSIDKLTEALEKSYGAEAMKTAQQLEEKYKSQAASQIAGLDAALWSNYGGGHSDYWHWNKNTGDIAGQIAQKYGLNFTGDWNSLFNNNDAEKVAEAIRDIRDNEAEWWRILTTQGYNEGAVKEWLESLIATADAMDAAKEQLKEQLTNTTADDVFDDFLSSLYELADGSEDVMDDIAENWQKMVNRMVVNNLVGGKMREQLEGWYEQLYQLNRERSGYTDDNGVVHGPISNEEYQRRLEELKKAYNDLVNDGKEQIEQFTKDGIIKPVEEATDEAKKYFEDLRDSWKSTLTDMSATTEDWKDALLDQVLNDLVESTILNVPLDVDTTEGKKHFEDFDAYLEDWTARYKKVLEDATLSDEERNARLKALIQEQTDERDKLAAESKKAAEGIGKDISEAFSNSLDNLGDTLLDTLLDAEKTAEQMGAEIGQTLVREMLKEMLAQEKYANQIAAIKQLWQNILKSENGQWTDTEGVFGEAGLTYTLDDVLAKITALNTAMSDNTDLQKMTQAYDEFGQKLKEVSSSFGDFHDDVMTAITDMEHGTEEFSKKLHETLLKDLIEKSVFGAEIKDLEVTVSVGQTENRSFANFDAYQKDWTTRYLAALAAGDKELMELLVAEMAEREKVMAESAEEYAKSLDALNKDTTFKDMTSGWVSSLMDFNATAEDWAEDIGRTMAQKIIEQMIVPTLVQPLLDTLQGAFDTALKAQEESSTDWSAVINADGVQTALKAIQDAYPELKETVTKILAALNITPEVEAAKEAFGDLTGTIVSGLTDAEMTAEEFSKNIARTLTEQLMKQIVESQFAETMKGIQEDWAKALESGDTSAIEAIRQRIVQLYKDAGRATNELRGIFEEMKEGDTTFKDMADTWVSALFDMDSTASDFGRKIGQTLVQKLVKELVVSKQLQPYLDTIQTAYNDAIGKEGATIESVLAAVVPLIDDAVAETEKWKPVIEEVAKRFKELDNSTPLDNIRSNFLSQLMDMKSDTKDFARSINEILTEAFIDKFVLGDEFDKRLEEWKNEYASIMGGNYSEEKRAELLNQLKRAITVARDGYAEEAKIIHDLMGTASYADQTATMNMSDKATQEQMDQYLGVQMGIYMVTEHILTTLRGGTTIDIPAVTLSSFSMATETTAKQILSAIQSMKAVTNPDSSTILEMRNMMATGNEYLLDIKRSNREILTQFGAVLNSINGKLAKL